VWLFGWIGSRDQFLADVQLAKRLGAPQLLLWESDYIGLRRPGTAGLRPCRTMSASENLTGGAILPRSEVGATAAALLVFICSPIVGKRYTPPPFGTAEVGIVSSPTIDASRRPSHRIRRGTLAGQALARLLNSSRGIFRQKSGKFRPDPHG